VNVQEIKILCNGQKTKIGQMTPVYNLKLNLNRVLDTFRQFGVSGLLVVVDDVHHLLLQVFAEHVQGDLKFKEVNSFNSCIMLIKKK
jgi:hypothetical protein